MTILVSVVGVVYLINRYLFIIFICKVQPKKISVKDKRYLQINWSDGSESMIALASLRKNCPCAVCKSERDKQPSTYIPLLSGTSLTLQNIKTMGTYGIQLFWQDGHDTGIYTYESLKEWGQQI